MSTIAYNLVPTRRDTPQAWPFIGSPQIYAAIHAHVGGGVSLFTTKSRGADAYKTDNDGKSLGGQNLYALNFKTTAYNYMPIFIDIPPKIDESGQEVEQSEMSTLRFREKSHRDLALSLLVGKWGYAWWTIYGDDFHVTAGLLGSFPIDLDAVDESKRDLLLKLTPKLRKSMVENKTVKRNKGMIYNWYIPGTRKITDQTDAIWADVFGAQDLLGQLQFQYYGTVKSTLSPDAADDPVAD